MKTKIYLSPKDYYWYIKSDAWRSKHYYWLKQSGNRCSMFPWIRIGKYARNKYGKYNIHHTGVGYKHLGHEELGRDVLPLCLFAHWLIHGGQMKAEAPWQPNIIQKSLHLWCSFPLIMKQLFLLFSSLLLVFYFFTLMRNIYYVTSI